MQCACTLFQHLIISELRIMVMKTICLPGTNDHKNTYTALLFLNGLCKTESKNLTTVALYTERQLGFAFK